MGDHLNLDGGRHDVLLNGKHERFRSLEDITQCRRVGNIGCSRTLLLHARVLDHHRYVDWSISVPLQMVEFYFILTAVKPDLGAGMFFRLFLGTCAMLAFGYSGEAHFLNAWAGFLFGLAGWAFILFEIFAGEAGKESASLGGNVKTAFDIMKFIVTVGWSIYPLGYFFGYLQSGVDDSTLNLVYNLADFVNKIAFCLAIWN